MRFKLFAMSGVALAATIIAAVPAQAEIYDFTFVGATYTIEYGHFATSGPMNGDGTFNITSANGLLVSANLALPQGPLSLTPGNGESVSTADSQENYSNLYTPGAPSFAFNGLELQGTGLEINLYNAVNSGYEACTSSDCLSVVEAGGALYNPGDLGVVSISAPEPRTWGLMLLGVGLLGGLMRYRRARTPTLA
jgi:hypothetical protein